MNRYTRAYNFNDKTFIYDREDCIVHWVYKLSPVEKKVHKHQIENGLVSSFNILTGDYDDIEGVGLRKENWENKELRDSYLAMWCDELDEELYFLMEDI